MQDDLANDRIGPERTRDERQDERDGGNQIPQGTLSLTEAACQAALA
jgi:hypothetical protein